MKIKEIGGNIYIRKGFKWYWLVGRYAQEIIFEPKEASEE